MAKQLDKELVLHALKVITSQTEPQPKVLQGQISRLLQGVELGGYDIEVDRDAGILSQVASSELTREEVALRVLPSLLQRPEAQWAEGGSGDRYGYKSAKLSIIYAFEIADLFLKIAGEGKS